MKHLAECVCALILLPSLPAIAAGDTIELKSGHEICALLKEMRAHLKGSEAERKFHVKTGKGATQLGVLTLTSKGNGTLSIANLLLRVFDEHDDGLIYKDGCFQVQFKERGKNSFPGLELTGIAIETDGKSDKPLKEDKIDLQYEYIPNERRFLKITKPYFDFIELKTGE
jgi:hypothetical protein